MAAPLMPSTAFILAVVIAACGCGGGSSGPPPPVGPSISAQPQSQTVTAPVTATFSVTATGTAPLSYQWNKNGAAISGATSATYTTPATTSADNGAKFTVVVTNSAGSITSDPASLTVRVLQMIAVSPANYSIQLGFHLKLSVTGTYDDGTTKDVTASASWISTNPAVAAVDNNGNATAVATGRTIIQATVGSLSAPTMLTVSPLGLLNSAGLWSQFERRGAPSEYGSGEVIQNWNQFDSVVNSTVSQEISLQLDKMKAMGVNTITFQLRAADPSYTGNFTPPDCNEPPVLGLQFPQPTPTELTNLTMFFDMVQSKGMKVWLSLINTHMEQQPPTNSQTWLGAILGAVGKHPALDLVSFDGDSYTEPGPNGTVICGTPAEAPLWLGPSSIPANYVQWAINFALSQGLPPEKLAAEAIVGNFYTDSGLQPAGCNATGCHLWAPIAVEKTIFDNLNIPPNQRTYVLSFYEHRKCSNPPPVFPSACTDLDPHDWADQTLQFVTSVTGAGPRIVALEMGDLPPVDQVNWNTQHAVESLVFLIHKYGLNGGSFWRWVSFNTSEDSDPTLAQPVKVRGAPLVYNLVQKEVVDMGGFHLASVPNGLFASATGGMPDNWTVAGSGTISQIQVTPDVPSRGIYAMQIITGAGLQDSVTATSAMIPVIAGTTYTTTSNLNFAWTGDPNPTGPPPSRPQVFITIFYYQQNGQLSSLHSSDTFAYFQENSTNGYGTLPVQYTTPPDAAFVTIQLGAARNGLPAQITLEVQNAR